MHETVYNENCKYFSVTHKIKAKNDSIVIPKLTDNDLVYVTGEIHYEKQPNGDKFVSVPNIFAKQILRMENHHKSDDIEQLAKGIIIEFISMGA